MGDAFGLAYRTPLPCEDWNAEISLLTGMVAAAMMLDGGIGILRTMPPADPRDVDRLRRSALALGIDWPDGTAYGDVVVGLDRAVPRSRRSSRRRPSSSAGQAGSASTGHHPRSRPTRRSVAPTPT